NVRFIFLAFFDGALLKVEILHGGESLNSLRRKISIGHGMSNNHWPSTLAAQLSRDQARHRTLAASGSHRAHGNDRNRRLELSVRGSQKPEIRVRSHCAGAEMHEVLVRNIAVGKH